MNVDLLQRQPAPEVARAAKTIAQMMNNIIAHPSEQKYRSINTANQNFSKNCWSVKGAAEALQSVGFELREGFVVLPESAGIGPLLGGLGIIEKIRDTATAPPAPIKSKPTAEQPVAVEGKDDTQKVVVESDTASASAASGNGRTPGTDPILREIRKEKREQMMSAKLEDNDPYRLELALDTLLRVFTNVLQHPEEERLRRLKTSGRIINNHVYLVPGGRRAMLESGWIETEIGGEEYAVFPPSGDLHHLAESAQRLKKLREENTQRITEREKKEKEEALEDFMRIKRKMKEQYLLQTAGGGGAAGPATGKPPTASQTSAAASSSSAGSAGRAALLQQLMQGGDSASSSKRKASAGRVKTEAEREVDMTASLIISEIVGMMEAHAEAMGQVGLSAPWRGERKRLESEFEIDRNIEKLHDLREVWSKKLRSAVIKHPLGESEDGGAAASAAAGPAGGDGDFGAEVERRMRQMLGR